MSEIKKKRWIWPLIALGAGIVASLILLILWSSLNWRIYLLVGIGVSLLVLTFNPALRYFRMGGTIVGIFSIVQSIGFKFGGEISGHQYYVFSPEFTTGVSVALIFLAGLVFILDFLERNGKGIPALSIQISRDKHESTVEGDQNQGGGDQFNNKGNTYNGSSQFAKTIINHAPNGDAPSISTPPKDLTVIIPRRPLDSTIGREEKLEELRAILLKGQMVAVVNGMGGIGKTTLAATYIGKHYEDYAHVAWITQKDENLEIDFSSQQYLLKSLGIDANEADPKLLFQEIVRRMKGLEESPCLLVIDNALDSIHKYHDLLPKGPKWHLLITSRSKPEHIPFIELGKLSPEKALELFKSICPRKYDQGRIESLLEGIEYHTLTVELLAKTAKTRHLTIEELEAALSNDQKAEVVVNHSEKEEIDRVTSYLSKVFALADLSPDEKWVLKQWTCLPLIFIPYEILQKLITPDKKELSGPLGKIFNSLAAKGFLQDN